MKRGESGFFTEKISVNKALVIMFVIVFFLLFIGFIIGYLDIITIMFGDDSKTEVCGDGTFYGTCSLKKPYYCESGFLIEKASICGCPDVLRKSGNVCQSVYQDKRKFVNLTYVLNGKRDYIPMNVFSDMADYLGNISRMVTYEKGQLPFRVDFKLRYINEPEQHYLLLPLVVEIQNRAKEKSDQARIAISLVQNIPFGKSQKQIVVGNGDTLDYSRYPYEVLYDNEGVCGEKSALLAYLLREIGYGVVIYYFKNQNHEAVGISCPSEYDYEDTGYCFVETSGPAIISDSSLIYSGGVRLSNNPELMLISEGLVLPDNLDEYDDAKKYSNARQSSSIEVLNKIGEYYGLAEAYYLD